MLGDRYETHVAKSQIGFFKFMIQPYFEELARVLPKLKKSVENNVSNQEYWASDEVQQHWTEQLDELNQQRPQQ